MRIKTTGNNNEALSKLQNYFRKTYIKEQDDSKKVLNHLLKLYDLFNPDWIEAYNDLNTQKSEGRKTSNTLYDRLIYGTRKDENGKIDVKVSIKDLKVNRPDGLDNPYDIMQELARIIHLSNKIAHEVDDQLRNSVLIRCLQIEKRDRKRFEGEIYKRENGKIKNIDVSFYKNFRMNLDLYRKVIAENNPKDKELLRATFDGYGLSLKDVMEIYSTTNFDKAYDVYNSAMNVKTLSIKKFCEHVEQNKMKEISYGIVVNTDQNGNSDRLFYIDLMGYGQFSVHLFAKNFKKIGFDIKDIPIYNMPFNNKEERQESLMLVPFHSEEFAKFISKYENDDAKRKPSITEEMGIGDLSYYRQREYRLAYGIFELQLGGSKEMQKSMRHQLGVMCGLSIEVLEQMYNSRNKEELLKQPKLEENQRIPRDTINSINASNTANLSSTIRESLSPSNKKMTVVYRPQNIRGNGKGKNDNSASKRKNSVAGDGR